jgi:hypothetical protein
MTRHGERLQVFQALHPLALATLALMMALAPNALADAGSDRFVAVNGVRLDDGTLALLELGFAGATIPDGRYWYDPVSGMWGAEGWPAAGQLLPWLPLGGPLRFDASGGASAVVVNGRALHPLEVVWLEQRLGPIPPGRYWLDAWGRGGVEGGPALFDIGVSAGDGRSIFGHSLSGSVISSGDGVGFVGGSVGVSCGPDGGCVYSSP